MLMSRLSLLTKLLLAILIPTVLTFAGFGLLGHFAAARALEAELGRRLQGIAAVVASQTSADSVALLQPGDEQSRTYRNILRRLTEARDAAGVARVYIFAVDQTVRVDTAEAAIGTRDYSLESSRAELRKVFAAREGGPSASILFRGRDGQLYKSGYAPVVAGTEAVQFAVGVDGSAAIYQDLQRLRQTLFMVGVSGAVAMILLAVLLGRRLTGPLLRLRNSARTVGSGVLDQPVEAALLRGRDEVAVLAQALETMRTDLRTRDERMQMMLAGIAHEVRNPLGGMELFAGLLQEELSAAGNSVDSFDVPTSLGYVARIKKELLHLQAVVADFLEYARRSRPALTTCAVTELLEEVAENAQAAAAPNCRVSVAVTAERVALNVLADATQLRRALLNLAQNAVQACAERSTEEPMMVVLSCSRVGVTQRVRISCQDTGAGIPEAVLTKIWTPFFTTRQQGTGLGLAFVREIVKEHGGELAVETSERGTTFHIDLPAAKST